MVYCASVLRHLNAMARFSRMSVTDLQQLNCALVEATQNYAS